MDEMARKKSDIGRMLACIGCCIFFAVCFWGVNVCAQEREENCENEGLVLTATFSFQDEETEEITLRAGRDFALRLKVTAQEEEFCGYVNVLMQNEGGNHVLYQQRVEALQPEQSFACQMNLPMNLMTGGLYLTLTNEEGSVQLEQTIPVETVNYGLYELTAFFDPEQEMGDESMYEYFSSYGNRLIAVSEPEMACGAQGMDALEIIVTQESVLEDLEERAAADTAKSTAGKMQESKSNAALAAESLKEWVAGGKTLVVGASAVPEAEEEMLYFGLQEKEILQEVVLRIGNYEATRESILATNAEIKKQYGENARITYIGDSMLKGASVNSLSNEAVRLPVSREQDREYWWNSDESYEILWQERGTDILRCYHVGQGNVLVFAIPITTEPAEIYPLFYYRMAELVLDNLAQTQIERQMAEMYGYSEWERHYWLPNLGAGNNGISVFPYVLILMCYILVLIPAVFWLLRRFERTKYIWGIIPLLSFAVMGVVYLTGQRTRITEPYCTYMDITDYTSGKQVVNFSLSAPTNQGTEIVLKPGTSVMLAETRFRAYEAGWLDDYVPQENILLAREYRVAVCAMEDGTRLGLDNIRAFSNTSFYAWAEAAPIEGELFAVVNSVSRVVDGTIRNTTELSFREVYVCSSDFAVRVGSIPPGGEISLGNCRQVVFGEDSGGVWGSEFHWLMFDLVGSADYTQANTLSYLIQDYMQDDDGQIYIFALPLESRSELLGQTAENPGSSGVQVFIWAAQAQQ